MNLDLFNNLDNNNKPNNFIKKFIEELTNHIESINNKESEKTIKSDEYRKENDIYQVVDFMNNGVYLQNVNSNEIFEETNIPKELLNKINNDSILRYKNGEYIYEEDMTEDFLNSLVDIKEYMKIQEEFIKNSDILKINPDTYYNIKLRQKEYTILNYEGDNTIKVPNALIPYFANNNSVLYYENGEFKRKV